ncbi:hypothetical protein COLO4_19267 [Corchorus olitorius]|uniref:Uncharacterized protein n=1 Tax=Corchorus olitorius TaxID=93759 RepID=A0A1R3J669_9ROSI|nr:hypothetical protein COLO4_19267 [Corchorus olitorius]
MAAKGKNPTATLTTKLPGNLNGQVKLAMKWTYDSKRR